MKTSTSRAAFTLIELLVVMAIMAILATVTLVVFRTVDNHRVQGSAGQVQSALAGARDRAIHAKSPRGIRFVIDPGIPGVVRTLLHVQPADLYSAGTATIGRQDLDGDGWVDTQAARLVTGTDTQWWLLKSSGVLTTGARIRLGGSWYTVDVAPLSATSETMLLLSDYRDMSSFSRLPSAFDIAMLPSDPAYALRYPGTHSIRLTSYSLEPNIPRESPGESPMPLARNVAIDLVHSRGIPPNGGQHFDVMFAAGGGCTGITATLSTIHFMLADLPDAEQHLDPAVSTGDKYALTLSTRAGSSRAHPVDPTDADTDGAADEPFRFAVK